MSKVPDDIDLSHPDYTGYLVKRSAWLKDWRRRYFILKGDKLYFSKGTNVHPHGWIDLSKCQTVKTAYDKTRKKHSFEVTTPDESYFMYADSEKEKDEWIGVIGRAIVRRSLKSNDSD